MVRLILQFRLNNRLKHLLGLTTYYTINLLSHRLPNLGNIVQQTQPLHQIVYSNVPVMGNVEWPLVQESILITTTQPIVEVVLTCAYCQHVGPEFKNFPFVDDKLKRLMKEELKTLL